MTHTTFQPATGPLRGEIEVPGDKSISHRSVIFGALAYGTTKVSHFLDGEDCMRTVEAFRQMGIKIDREGSVLKIHGKGPEALKEPQAPLYFGNSGTTTRLMLGLLAGLPFFTVIYGDSSLSARPMDRVVNPLRQMGAEMDGRKNGSYLPLAIRGKKLQGMDYSLPVKSAQVKSAVLLAGLFADDKTIVREDSATRDHTEKMLQAYGADITANGLQTSITSGAKLKAGDIYVPGDISSAAFFLAAAAIIPGSHLVLKTVGLNETRTGLLDVLQKMGGNIRISNRKSSGGEDYGDITVSYASLHGITIEGKLIPRLIDEIPVIALLATQAEGTTVIRDAEELRIKETDRISAVCDVLQTLGADIEPTADGMIIHGKSKLTGGKAASYQDHRIAMMAAIAALAAQDEVVLDDASSISVSYPDFFADFTNIQS